MKKEPTLHLVAIKGASSKVIQDGTASILTTKGKSLKKLPQWKGYYFQIRSVAGYKNKPIWPEGKSL